MSTRESRPVTIDELLELVEILSKRLQDGGFGMADCATSPLSEFKKKLEGK